MLLAYPYSVRDSSNTSTDNRKTGLAPTVSAGKTLAASPATVLASTVSVVEIGAGDYIALYDAEANGDASFPVDWGAALANPNDRYGTLILTREAGRVIDGYDSAVVRVGAAQAGASATITLDAGASSTDGSYVGHTLRILSGAGAGGARQIVGYNGTTKVATVNRPWSTAPDNTTRYAIAGQVVALVDGNTDAVLSLTAGAIATQVDSTLSASHGSGPWGGNSGNLPGGVVVNGSTASAVTLSGLAANKNFAGQRLLDTAAGEYRTIATQSYAGGAYTLNLGAGSGESGPFSAAPATGATLYLCP